MDRRIAIVIVAAALAVGGAGTAGADGPLQCRGVTSGHFSAVSVEPGGFCVLRDATVAGAVTAGPGATLGLDGTRVGGEVVGDRADSVQLFGTTVGGRVSIRGATGRRFFAAVVCGSSVLGGDLEVTGSHGRVSLGDPSYPDVDGCPGNRVSSGALSVRGNMISRRLWVHGNRVAGSLSVTGNRGAGPKGVEENSAGRKIRCAGNARPFRARGQCSDRP